VGGHFSYLCCHLCIQWTSVCRDDRA
jgi:hypothetical protein